MSIDTPARPDQLSAQPEHPEGAVDYAALMRDVREAAEAPVTSTEHEVQPSVPETAPLMADYRDVVTNVQRTIDYYRKKGQVDAEGFSHPMAMSEVVSGDAY